MSQPDDVIKIHFKSSLSKTKKHSFSNLVEFELPLRFETIYYYDFTSPYCILIHRAFYEGHEIVHMFELKKT